MARLTEIHHLQGRRGPAMTPPEEKEDTVGSVTMINGAMPSPLMG
jgi:hypothetical protein